MARVVASLFALAFFAPGAWCEDDVEFQDTPLLTSIFEATRDSDNDAIDRLFDSSELAAKSRASDGRGPAWWAYEFQNAYVLGAMNAFGADMESTSEDLQGQSAVQMCTENPDCDKDELVTKAKALVDDIKKRKEERAKA